MHFTHQGVFNGVKRVAKGLVQHERVWNRNYVWLLHSYEIYVLGCEIILSPFYCLCKPQLFSYHDLNQNHSKPKLQFSQTLHSSHNFVQVKVFLKVTNTSLYTNQKEKKSRNFLKLIHHKVPQKIKKKQNRKETKSYGSPRDSTINHKETISHGAHVIPQLITRKQYHMVHMTST